MATTLAPRAPRPGVGFGLHRILAECCGMSWCHVFDILWHSWEVWMLWCCSFTVPLGSSWVVSNYVDPVDACRCWDETMDFCILFPSFESEKFDMYYSCFAKVATNCGPSFESERERETQLFLDTWWYMSLVLANSQLHRLLHCAVRWRLIPSSSHCSSHPSALVEESCRT